jgi:hypothetical protein
MEEPASSLDRPRAPVDEMPRGLRRGPPITVKCECGERRELRYGQVWKCESCGRRYDTNKIPADEYASFHRQRVHDRIIPSIVIAIIVVISVGFILAGRALALVLIVPTAGFMWGTFARPRRRRRQYQAIADRPRWQIKAD